MYLQSPLLVFASILQTDNEMTDGVQINKRSTMLINKLVQDLQRAFSSNKANEDLVNPMSRKRKVYVRCYFNAASCFSKYS